MLKAEAQVSGSHTWNDYLQLDEEGRYELLDGQLIELEVPTRTHERIVATLIVILGSWAWAKQAGQILASGYKVRITNRRGIMPDIQFYRRDNLPEGQEKGLEKGCPDLAIEVISPTSRSRDSVRKLQDYASIGVPEYWLIDPEASTIQRFVLRGGVYSIVEGHEGDATFWPSGFDELEIPLARLWNE